MAKAERIRVAVRDCLSTASWGTDDTIPHTWGDVVEEVDRAAIVRVGRREVFVRYGGEFHRVHNLRWHEYAGGEVQFYAHRRPYIVLGLGCESLTQ